MGRIIAFDYGEKKIGAAVSDPMKIIASSIPVITYSNKKELNRKLDQLFKEYEIETIVLGNPLNLDGTDSELSIKVKEFAEKHLQRFGKPIRFWDERLTSISAKKEMVKMNIKQKGNKKKVDEIAANLLLQSFLGGF